MPSHLHDDVPRFCSHCGGTLIQSLLKPGEPHRPVCRACGYVVYFDPKVVVGTIISNHRGQVAMVRRAIEPGYGKWVFPGGFMDRGERVEDAAIRETWEEANLTVEIDRLLNVYSYSGQPTVIVVYLVNIVSGELKAMDETLEAATFAPDEIPWDGLAFESTREALREYLALPNG